MHYAYAPDISLCQCFLCFARGTTFLANFQLPPKIAEIRHFPSATAVKTVELE
jgi:hypothetical protein